MKISILLLILTFFQTSVFAQSTNYDVLIYGATPAGVAAAVNAADEGMKVALLEETDHIGGLASGGLSNTDFQSFESLGGTFRDFMDRVVAHYAETYGPNSQQVKDSWQGAFYEPKVARQVFVEMMEEHEHLDVLLKHRLQQAFTDLKSEDDQTQLEKIRVLDLTNQKLKEFTAKVFIDATYEGDLMAAAGVKYTIGSEGPKKYGESAASPQDWHVQCYNFRVTLTKDPDNSIPIPKPENYNPENYQLLIEGMEDGTIKELDDIIRGDVRQIPNQKADFNDSKGSKMSIKLCNETDVWPEGSPEVRQQVWDKAKNHTLGVLYFLQNNPEVLPAIQEEMNVWNLPKDEFEEYGNFPPVIYVREGRRMVGERVFVQKDAQRTKNSVRAPAFEDAIAIGDYSLNSHGTYYTCDRELLGNLSAPTVPFQVPYPVLLPKKVDGLLVPVAVSASRVGYGGIRMEPVWTALGQAAGLAAAQSVETNSQLREIDVTQLQQTLHEKGALTFYTSDVSRNSPYFKAVQYFGNRGLFQNLIDPATATNWKRKKLDPKMVQWTEAYPYHAIAPEEKMDRDLAEAWLKLLNIENPALVKKSRRMNRGGFLNILYEVGY